MTRTVSYPQFVNIKSINSFEVGKYRYWLKIPFKNHKTTKTLCVILKNPSVANIEICDNTVSKVCNVANNNGYSEVIILNLFPYRSTNSKGLLNFYTNQHFKLIMACNLHKIKNICKNKDVVFAWGTNTISKSIKNKKIYDSAIKNITLTIKNQTHYVRRCSCLNKSCNNKHQAVRYPLHGLRWHNNSAIIQY